MDTEQTIKYLAEHPEEIKHPAKKRTKGHYLDKERTYKVRQDAHWDVRLAEMAAKLIAAGFTYGDIGVVLGVSEICVRGWTQKYASFFEAAKIGHEAANAITLGQMLRAAWGYDYDEVKEEYIVTTDENGEEKILDAEEGEKTPGCSKKVTVFHRHQPPNGELLKFILLNREKDDWKDAKRLEVTENRNIQITGLDEIKVIDDFVNKFLEHAKQVKQIESKIIDAEPVVR
jgi:hypothetical protein